MQPLSVFDAHDGTVLVGLHILSAFLRHCIKFGHIPLAGGEVNLHILAGKRIDGLQCLMEDAILLNGCIFTLRSSCCGLAYEWY
jgi:hypothetical protein